MLNRTAIIKQPDNISFFNDIYKLQKEYQDALILDNSNPDFIWIGEHQLCYTCLLYTSPSPRDISGSRMPSSA